MIWTDAQLSTWETDALGQIATDVNCIWACEALPVTKGVSVITLPAYVRTITRITWRGWTLDAANWEELSIMLAPATVFVAPGSTANFESSQGRPLYYALHPTNPWDIRLFPCPSESFTPSQISDPYSPTVNQPGCVVSYWREPDGTGTLPAISLPSYIARRTVKSWVLWHAFAAEGKGQDLKAANYYMQKYNFLISQFRAINEGCFVGKKYSVDDGMLSTDNFRYPKPLLPANFERIIY